MKILIQTIQKIFGVCMHQAARDLLKAQADIGLLNQQVAWLIKRVDTLEKAGKVMSSDLDKMAASVTALETAESAFLADAARLMADFKTANASLASGQAVSEDALTALQARIDKLTSLVTAADASVDAADPAAPVAAPVEAPAAPSA